MIENQFAVQLSDLSDVDLVSRFNNDVGNPGWVGARGRFHAALRQEFVRRGIEYSAAGDATGLSLAKRVKLEGKTLIAVED